MVSRLNIAVIGAGCRGKEVINEYRELSKRHLNINLSMVCDLLDENLSHCREAINMPDERLVKEYMEVLDSRIVDAVHICTPNETHYQVCKDSLESGKHVLSERPLTTNSQEAHELVRMAELQDRILQVGYTHRFNNALKRVRRLLRNGFFEDICHLKLRWAKSMRPLNGDDVIFDLASDPMDILNYLLDQWPRNCTTKMFRGKHQVNFAFVFAEFPGDITANIELGWGQPEAVKEIFVIGSKRFATIDCRKQRIRIRERRGNHKYEVKAYRNNALREEVAHFASCALNNHRSIDDGLTGAKNVEVLESIIGSMD